MKKIYLHPIPVRVWHWINALGFIILIITGAQIRFGDAMGLMSFETATDIHSWTGFILLANYFIWFIYYIFTGKFFKIYIPAFWRPVEYIKNSIKQAKYYGYGIMISDKNPHHPTPENKFNPMQQATYFMIMAVLIPIQILTGLMLWDSQLFKSFIDFIGGIQIVSLIHVAFWIFSSAFIIVHIYLATLGHTPLAHFKAMFTGYEEEPDEH